MKIALVGNQNCGKTTLFNALTGSNQKVGNWPGVTIEKKIGRIKNLAHDLVDLPGIYSLSPYTNEEIISRDYILKEEPNLIINVVDATNIERSLYLTTQLLEFDCNVVVALNMCDLLLKNGIEIDENKLSKILNTKVIKISALKKEGLENLIQTIKTELDSANKLKKPKLEIFDKQIEINIEKIKNTLSVSNRRFVAIKMLEQDSFYHGLSSDVLNCKKNIENFYNSDIEQIFAGQRYDFVEVAKSKCFKQTSTTNPATDKLDKIFLNKFLAIPIFALIMALTYFLSVGIVGKLSSNIISSLFLTLTQKIEIWLKSANASAWAISLICNGVLTGVGTVINFVPQLIVLFACISILETSGYMSRIALFFDKIFRKFGLSGKSLIPFIVGTGCSVPAIMTTRTIENEDEKQSTIMLTPFIPCSAKLPIISLFASYFFSSSWIVTISLYLLSVIVVIICAIVLKFIFFKKQNNVFVTELPAYKMPSFKYVARDVFEKTFSFIKRAGTTICMCSVVVWFLLSFDTNLCFTTKIETSLMAKLGSLFSWFFYPILATHSWAAAASAIQGLVAKEQVVSSMAIIAGLSGDLAINGNIFATNVFRFFTPATAYAFVVFNLFSAPCISAIIAMKKELGSNKKVVFAIIFQILAAFLLSSTISIIGKIVMIL